MFKIGQKVELINSDDIAALLGAVAVVERVGSRFLFSFMEK